MAMTEPKLKDIVDELVRLGYFIDRRKYALNVVGIRSDEKTSPVNFDDYIATFYFNENGKLEGDVVPATTDPSVNYLKKPMNALGTAVLKAGQYRDTYAIGLHRGKYQALTQQLAPVTVIRDSDRNAYINYLAPTYKGYFGINIHRASRGKSNEAVIGLDSAGCQVFRDEKDFDKMMILANRHKDLYGNKFTYTLIDRRDSVKFRNTSIVLILAGFMAVYGFYVYKKLKK
jgi:hypothetical protein